MEKKEGLNNTQRKMLDEIYSEQFEKIASTIIRKRQDGFNSLVLQVENDERKKDPVKSILKGMLDVAKLVEKHKEYLLKNGIGFENLKYNYDREADIELKTGKYGDYPVHPKLKKYQDETSEIELNLAKRKKEIRARIYGMDTTYADVERDIEKELADIRATS